MPLDTKTRFYTTEKLGPRRELTQEGFLVCYDVPICRTGMMLYGPGETPVSAGPGGVTKIYRRPEEVFQPDTIASFNGKPVVNDHPEGGEVTLANWRELTMGTVLHPRRGEGVNDDCILADFLITDAEAIRLILEEGKDEVSCGYDAEYIEIGPGEGYQKGIIGNHVALVEAGRCGARCSIGDSVVPAGKSKCKGEKKLPTRNSFLDRLNAALSKHPTLKKTLDDEMAMPDVISGDEEMPAVGGVNSAPHIHIHTGLSKDSEESEEKGRSKWDDKALDAKFDEFEKKTGDNHKAVMDSIEGLNKKMSDAVYTPANKTGDAEEEEEKRKKAEDEKNKSDGDLEEEEPKKATGDSAKLIALYRETVAQAEIVAPGVRTATMDSAAPARKTVDTICDLRRRALDAALKDPETEPIVTAVRGVTLDAARLAKLDCPSVRTIFRAVALIKSQENVMETQNSVTTTVDTKNGVVLADRFTVADLNKRNAEFYKN